MQNKITFRKNGDSTWYLCIDGKMRYGCFIIRYKNDELKDTFCPTLSYSSLHGQYSDLAKAKRALVDKFNALFLEKVKDNVS